MRPLILQKPPRCRSTPLSAKIPPPNSAAATCGWPNREEPMTSATSIARRDMILAAGAGLATGLLGGANAQPAAAQSGEFWTAESTAKKGEMSLQIYRKRVGAPPAGDPANPALVL